MVQPVRLPRRLGRGRLSLRALLAASLLAALFSNPVAAQSRFPGATWDHATPAQSNWSAEKLTEAHAFADQIHLTGFMAIHHGVVVAEWGDTAKRTELASVRKSLLSALYGNAVAEKKISLDGTLASLDIDDNPPKLSDLEKTATVRMLLEARSGIYHPALYETPAMAKARPARGSHAPGTFWYYNNWDFNAAGTIYERETRTGIYDALVQQIARPIGMQDYRPQDGEYFTGPDSIHRAYPIRMSARDLARFALLYLHEGNWAGHQVVPAAWVKESTTPYSFSPNGSTGYGYLWWTAPANPTQGGLPKGTFFAWGAGGQFAFVVPSSDLVVVQRVDRDQHLREPTLLDVIRQLRMTMAAGNL